MKRTLAGPHCTDEETEGEILWLARVRTGIAACVASPETDEGKVGRARIHAHTSSELA